MIHQTCRECSEPRPLVNDDGLCPLCVETAPPRFTVEEELAICLEETTAFLRGIQKGEPVRVLRPSDFYRWGEALERSREPKASEGFQGFQLSSKTLMDNVLPEEER